MFWDEIKERDGAAWLSGDGYEAVIYQGIKIVKDEDGFHFLSTESDMYPRVQDYIVEVFYEHGLDEGLSVYKMDKYKRQLKEYGASSKIASGLIKKIELL